MAKLWDMVQKAEAKARPARKAPAAKPAAMAKPKGKGGRPRIGEESSTNKAQKPWEKLGMSERTWYRRQAEKRQP